MGMMVPPEWGGAGMDTISYVLAMEEISTTVHLYDEYLQYNL